MNPLTRAYAALAVIDEYNQLAPWRQGGQAERNYHAAIDRLGDALYELNGPLPAIRVRGCNDDEADE